MVHEVIEETKFEIKKATAERFWYTIPARTSKNEIFCIFIMLNWKWDVL